MPTSLVLLSKGFARPKTIFLIFSGEMYNVRESPLRFLWKYSFSTSVALKMLNTARMHKSNLFKETSFSKSMSLSRTHCTRSICKSYLAGFLIEYLKIAKSGNKRSNSAFIFKQCDSLSLFSLRSERIKNKTVPPSLKTNCRLKC